MDTFGQHVLVEYHGCSVEALDDEVGLEELLCRAAKAAGATVLQTVFHRFSPHGVSGTVIIRESHLSIHTWPEAGYAAVDFYTCGLCDPSLAHTTLEEGLGATGAEVMAVHRGLGPPGASMVVHRHGAGALDAEPPHPRVESGQER